MTAPELISFFNKTFGLNPWPKTFEVDADTYANCCQYLLDNEREERFIYDYKTFYGTEVFYGKVNKGLMFKGVELILQGYKR